MDNLRGIFDSSDMADDGHDWDGHEEDSAEDSARDLPPEAIGQDERRMQVRAYNHWASLLGDKTFPSIEDLEPHNLDDFGPNSVLLDFGSGIEDPAVQYLGRNLAEECGAEGEIRKLSDVPPRSLLSRITDHYLQILANEAPIGFEAEFVNQRGASIMYRGILLPFSSDDETIDFIYGVINWKEIADQVTTDELLLEIDQALEEDEVCEQEDEPHKHHADQLVDAPSADIFELGAENVIEDGEEPAEEEPVDNVEPIAADYESPTDADDIPLPDFGKYTLEDPELGEDDEDSDAGYSFASLSDYIETPAKKAIDLDADKFDPADYEVEQVAEISDGTDAAALTGVAGFSGDDGNVGEIDDLSGELGEDAGLADYLASARALAENARASEERSRQALYAAVSRAYDFSLAAKDAPEDYRQLLEDSGLSVQERAPMTPIVKLVFGVDYDKTRLTEYAAVLAHAHRLEIERGALADFLAKADGGLKGVVAAERRLRREEAGKSVEPAGEIRKALAEKLRELEELTFEALAAEGPEFSLVMVRRDGQGGVSLLGEIEDDIPLIERAARKLVG